MNSSISSGLLIFIAIGAVWELIWKGFALWRSARRHEKAVFIAILVINTVGIFPMIYLYLTRNQQSKPPTS